MEVGEGIAEEVEQELAKIENPANNQDDFEAQPVGTDKKIWKKKPYCAHNDGIWSG